MRSLTRWLNDRIDLAALRQTLLDRPVPRGLTWWHTLGSATLAVFIVQVVTGIVLATYYAAAPDHAYDSIGFIQTRVAGGALIRGMHHWGSSAMVVLVLAHMARVFTWGAYKYPREPNWLLGLVLLIVVLGFGFTGYLLPWDQKAYWATEVGTNIAGVTPLVGGALVRLLRGGSQLGAATLSRFYALHVLFFPILLGGLVLLHVAMVIRQGIAARPWALESLRDPATGAIRTAPPHTGESAYREFYQTAYAAEKTGGVRFWPDIIVKDAVVALLVIGVIVLLALSFGAGLEAPADPTDHAYVPRPEWYFLPFYQLLKLVPGRLEGVIAVGIPVVLVLALLLLPFIDTRSTRSLGKRPIARLALVGGIAISAFLFGGAVRESPPSPAETFGLVLTSTQRAGRALFLQQQCNSCHKVAGIGGSKEDQEAPDLSQIGLLHSPGWLHSFLENPTSFHPDSKMPAYGPPTLTHQEMEEIAQYLGALRGSTGAARQPEYADTFPVIKPPEKK
jgi:ubiquinol-cytochrome c reductase cytochrome b subunit